MCSEVDEEGSDMRCAYVCLERRSDVWAQNSVDGLSKEARQSSVDQLQIMFSAGDGLLIWTRALHAETSRTPMTKCCPTQMQKVEGPAPHIET